MRKWWTGFWVAVLIIFSGFARAAGLDGMLRLFDVPDLENVTSAFVRNLAPASCWSFDYVVAGTASDDPLRNCIPGRWASLLNPLLQSASNASLSAGSKAYWMAQSPVPFASCGDYPAQSPIKPTAADIAAAIEAELKSALPKLPQRIASSPRTESLVRFSRPIFSNRTGSFFLPTRGPDYFTVYHPATNVPQFLTFVRIVSPAEHQLGGNRAALEVQLGFSPNPYLPGTGGVRDANDETPMNAMAANASFVVSALYDAAVGIGQPNSDIAAISELVDASSSHGGTNFDASALLPQSPYLLYTGTATIPPCTPDVTWVVPLKTRRASNSQIMKMRTLLGLSSTPANITFFARGAQVVTGHSYVEAQGNGRSAFAVTADHALRISMGPWSANSRSFSHVAGGGDYLRAGSFSQAYGDPLVVLAGGYGLVIATSMITLCGAFLVHRWLTHVFAYRSDADDVEPSQMLTPQKTVTIAPHGIEGKGRAPL